MNISKEELERIDEWADSQDRVMTSYNKGLKDGATHEHLYMMEKLAEKDKEIERLKGELIYIYHSGIGPDEEDFIKSLLNTPEPPKV